MSGFAGLEVFSVDGCDYFAVRKAGSAAVDWVRSGRGVGLLHAKVTRPFSHSSADTQSKYRSVDDLAEEARHDPIDLFAAALVQAEVLTQAEVEEIRQDACSPRRRRRAAGDRRRSTRSRDRHRPCRVDAGARRHRGHPRRRAGDARRGDQPGTRRRDGEPTSGSGCSARTSPTRQPELLADVEGKGGVFGLTKGLQRRFGSDRCFNTPLAEAAIVGRGVGQAVRGLRPCAEIQFFDYIWPAMTQIRSEAATTRWRSAGAFHVPLVIRVPIGGYLTGGAIWHSQCGESIFAHIPGLLVAFPSRAADAVGLLHAAFRHDDPVMFLEHKHLLRQPYAADPYPGPDHLVPFGHGVVRRAGTDAHDRHVGSDGRALAPGGSRAGGRRRRRSRSSTCAPSFLTTAS